MKILSFIIPAYNSAAFLEKCVSSMLNLKVLDKLEILIINDGSTDTTVQIAQGYCERYPDTVHLISQPNKGHGGALNTGFAAAIGKYLKVIDADDWIQTKNLPKFIHLLEVSESDVVLTHYQTIDISTGEIKNWRSYPKKFEEIYTLRDVMDSWRSFDRALTFHGITYRRDFYQKYAQPLPEHVFYEDHVYATFPCCQAEKLVCFDLFIYEYRIGDISQSVSAANQLRRIGQTETVIRRMMEQCQALPEGDGKHYAAMKMQGLVLSYITTALLGEPKRKSGRQMAAALMADCKRNVPDVYTLALSKYRIFQVMNLLKLNKNTWDRIQNSWLYNHLRGNHSFK